MLKTHRKILIYLILLMFLIAMNIIYYRKVILDHWLQYNVNDEFIMVSSLIEPNADNSTCGKLDT